MQTKRLVRYALLILCYVFCAAGQSLCLKADIGVLAAWDSLSLNLADITGIKVGYYSILFNGLAIAFWFFLLRKELKPIRLLSIPLVLFFGFAVNFFYYDIFTFEVNSYLLRLCLLILGNLLLAFPLGYITLIDLISFPVEGICYTLEEKYGWPFKRTRTLIDILCIISSLMLSFVFGTSLKIREGTVISMLMLGPLEGVSMDLIRKFRLLEKI